MSETPPKLRSPLSAYGPLIAVGAVILTVLGVLFSMQLPETPQPINAEEEFRKKAEAGGLLPMEKLRPMVDNYVKSTRGDWDRVPQEDRQKINDSSMGNGYRLFQSRVTAILGFDPSTATPEQKAAALKKYDAKKKKYDAKKK